MVDPYVTRLVGVYDADGGLLGEAAYVWGKVRGTRHCALCDITHGRVRRKPEWDRMVADLGVPVDLLHLDEMPPDVREAAMKLAIADGEAKLKAVAEGKDAGLKWPAPLAVSRQKPGGLPPQVLDKVFRADAKALPGNEWFYVARARRPGELG